MVELNKDLAIMLNVNFILLNKNNNCSQNEEMKAQILDKYKEAVCIAIQVIMGKCLYYHKKTSLLMQYSVYFCIYRIDKQK